MDVPLKGCPGALVNPGDDPAGIDKREMKLMELIHIDKVFYSPFLATFEDTESKGARVYGETSWPNALKKSVERF